MRNGFVIRWTAIGAIGTVIGLGVAGFVGLMGLAAESLMASVTSGLVFGATIGVSIGLAQGAVLAGRVDGLSPTRWATHTAGGAAVAWAVVAYPIGQLAIEGVEPSWPERILWAIAIGVAAGGIVGFIQWLDLRHHVPDSRATIASQAAAWSVGAVILGTIDGLVGTELSEPTGVLLVAGALLLAGATVGLIQGIFLRGLIPKTRRFDDHRQPPLRV